MFSTQKKRHQFLHQLHRPQSKNLIWKISDASERLNQQIDLEKPIDEILRTTTDDVLADFSTPIKNLKKTPKKTLKTKIVKKQKGKKEK